MKMHLSSLQCSIYNSQRYILVGIYAGGLNWQRAVWLPQCPWLTCCSPWASSLSALPPWVMASGLLDTDPVGLGWTCYSLTFNNIYIVLWEGRLRCFVCTCSRVGVYPHATLRAAGEETNNSNSLIMYMYLVSLVIILTTAWFYSLHPALTIW